MRTQFLTLTVLALGGGLHTAATAEETRQLDAHEHGVGTLDIAVEGSAVDMAFAAPGADIVGFEYEAKSDADKASIEAAIATLSEPLALFQVSEAAGCSVVSATARLVQDDHDHDHDHAEEVGHDDHDHDHDHAEEAGHDDHDHDHDHAEDAGHDDHDHAHDDHNHDHADGSRHTEFEAEYSLTCTDVGAIDSIVFAYFERFPNALEVEVQIVTDSGAQAFEVPREAPELTLSGMF